MSKGLGEQLTYSGSSLDARETIILLEELTIDNAITNISNAYPGLRVKVIERLEKSDFTGELLSFKIYEIKKTSNRNKPLPANLGGYELIQEPKDLKYPDNTSFLNSDNKIDIDTLKSKNIPELQSVPMQSGFYYTISNNVPWEKQLYDIPIYTIRSSNMLILFHSLSTSLVNFGDFSQALINRYSVLDGKQLEILIFDINKCSNGYLSSDFSYKFIIPLNIDSTKTTIKCENGIDLECEIGIDQLTNRYGIEIVLPDEEPNPNDYRVMLSFSNILDTSGKTDKVIGNDLNDKLVSLDENGNIKNSGITLSALRTELDEEYVQKPSIDPTDGQILSYDETNETTKWIDNTTVHIKYAANITPTESLMHNSIQSGDFYIGIYSDNNSDASTNYNDYQWSQIIGKSALQIYNEAYNTSLNEADFINVLKLNYPMINLPYNQTAAELQIGTAFLQIDTLSASSETVGKLYLMPNDDDNPTNTILFVTVQTPNVTPTEYKWYSLGELNIPSNVLTENNVDNTQLLNPLPNTLAKAEDVQDKIGNLYGENKPQFTVIDGYSVNGTTGELSESASSKYTEIELLPNAETIQFKGLYVGHGYNYSSGFAFGHYVDNVWVKDEAAKWDVRTTSGNSTKIYTKNIPENATHFRMTIYSFTLNTGDIILYYEGDVQRLAKLNIVDNLNTNDPEKVLSAKQGVVLKDIIKEITDSSKIVDIQADALYITRNYISMTGTPHWIYAQNTSTAGCWIYDISNINNGALTLKVKANSTAGAQVLFLTEVITGPKVTSDYDGPQIPANLCSVQITGGSNIGWMAAGAEISINIPSDCLSIYILKTAQSGVTTRLPELFEIGGFSVSLSELNERVSNLESKTINLDEINSDIYNYPLYNLDENGFGLPATMQENIAIRKANQLRFTGVPTSSVRYGVPYSSNWEYYRYVGMSVSVYTYLSARANQYSLYNTENINSSASNQSAWGRHYHSTNDASRKFYGNVCCSFTALVAGQPFVINNPDFELGVTQGVLTRVNKAKKVNPYELKIGDVFNNLGHSFSVYGIKYDGNRDVVAVRIAESTQGRYETNDTGTSNIIIGGIRLHLYSLDEFVEKVNNESFTHYRYNTMAKNLEYEKYATDPTNIQLEDTPQGKAQYTDSNNVTHEYEVGDNDTADVASVAYSTEICCFAGDKACFPVGELVVVNYALTSGTDISAYDRMVVYKDGVLLDTVTVLLSDAEQDSLVVSAGQAGHAVNLGESLQAGKYEACLANDSTESDEKTYWEVIDNSTLTLDSAGNLVVGFDKPVKGYWLGTMRDNNDGSYTFMGSKTTCRVATDDELYNQQITIDSGKLAGYTHIRLHIQGEYGMAAVVKPIPVSSESVNVEEQTNENAGE